MEIEYGNLVAMIVFFGVMVGITARTLLPYYGKLMSGEIHIFDKRFAGTAIGAFAASLTPAIIFFPIAMEKIGPESGNFGLPIIFVIAVFMGAGTNDLANMIMKYFAKPSTTVSKKIEEEVRKQVRVELNALKQSEKDDGA
jgi:hypothetical protein